MANIKHLVTIDAERSKIYGAVTREDGLKNWWTDSVKAEPIEGAELIFNFGPDYHKKIKVIKLEKDKYVEWKCLEAHPEWVGTVISFDIQENENGSTTLLFSHTGWQNETDMYALCNHHWGRYMQSLQQYCEQGKGNPNLSK